MTVEFTIIFMVFCHIFDDYFLQLAFLSKGKQRQWWREVAPNPMYSKDYIICLLMHGFSWSFMVLLPVAIYYNFNVGINFVGAFMFHAGLHALIDDLKANVGALNLVQDQALHFIQLIIIGIQFFA